MTQTRTPEIFRWLQFTVASTEKNTYGDLLVTSTGGHKYKVANKRNQLFPIFQPDAEVVVGYATYMSKDYIATASQANQFVGETPPELETPQTKTEQPPAGSPKPKPQSSPEIGLAYKEIGENIRAGIIKKDNEATRPFWTAYWAWLIATLDIKVTKKEE